MNSKLFLIPVIGLAIASCNNPNEPKKADNTARNAQADRYPTSGNQSEADVDIQTTKRIRKALMDDDTLSTNAKNIKVITEKNGNVFLRGPVESDQEKKQIESIVRDVEGVRNINNKLEVITK